MDKENNTAHKFYERLTSVEVSLKELKCSFDEFKNNHFHAFKKDVKDELISLDEKFNSIKDGLCKDKARDKRPTWSIVLVLTILSNITIALIIYTLTK